jgi:hypothetical protein
VSIFVKEADVAEDEERLNGRHGTEDEDGLSGRLGAEDEERLNGRHRAEDEDGFNGRLGAEDEDGSNGRLAERLAERHLEALRRGSGIADDVIEARGYRTVTKASELAVLGFSREQCRAPGLLLPLHTTDGSAGMYVYRPDNARVFDDKAGGRLADGTYRQRVIKYELPKGAAMRVDCPPACRPLLADPQVTLWITEGQKKADALASRGLCALALLGVWNFKGRNGFGGTTLLADFDSIAWRGRKVRIVFDSDVADKEQVRQALERLSEHLRRKGAQVAAAYLPAGPDGKKAGVDDWLVAGHSDTV